MLRRLTILVPAALAAAHCAFGGGASRPRPRQPESERVADELAHAYSWRTAIPTVGDELQRLEVACGTSGLVRAIHFRSGERVEAGQLLVQLEDTAERTRIAALRLRLARARAELVPGLTEPDGRRVPREIEAVTAELAEALRLADAKRVLAPASGCLGPRAIAVGQHVRSGDVLVELCLVEPVSVYPPEECFRY